MAYYLASAVILCLQGFGMTLFMGSFKKTRKIDTSKTARGWHIAIQAWLLHSWPSKNQWTKQNPGNFEFYYIPSNKLKLLY